ncbi:2145_t:CDS:2 [Paraglomus brasilianum]|uniref:2145_t:CDS:1 n=1 Tax=Paraglomus brasilianum TaxID=144538 RepID=A0A9N9FEX9_9GLOM|nr:2145_t:CDS:2 [Paraglomus brasilianum]
MEQFDDTQSTGPSESLHTIPIYNLDASSSDSDSDENAPAPTAAQQGSILSNRQPIQMPSRSFTLPAPRLHDHNGSEISGAAESIQTRPSVDEEYLFEEEDSEEDYRPAVRRPPAQTEDSKGIITSGVLSTSPTPGYGTRSMGVRPDAATGGLAVPTIKSSTTTTNIVEVPELTTRKMDGHGLRQLNLLGSADKNITSREVTSVSKMEKGIGGGIGAVPPTHQSDVKKEVSIQYRNPDDPYQSKRRSKEESYRDSYRDSQYHDSADLLPLTLVSGTSAGGMSFSSNYAYLSPPFGRTISRAQIMSRVAWFSQLFAFNIIYACYRILSRETSAEGEVVESKNPGLKIFGWVIAPVVFLLVYLVIVTIWTAIELRNKGFYSAFTIFYYSPLMVFSLFFGEKKRVDVSEFHEVNYGAKWWRLGTARVREGLVMTVYCLFIISLVLSDIIGRAVNSPNGQVSSVFRDFVPVAFMLVVYFLGFVVSIWGVVEAMVGPGVHGSGEGRKRLVGVLPTAFKKKAG